MESSPVTISGRYISLKGIFIDSFSTSFIVVLEMAVA
jgi:hypothetical protein